MACTRASVSGDRSLVGYTHTLVSSCEHHADRSESIMTLCITGNSWLFDRLFVPRSIAIVPTSEDAFDLISFIRNLFPAAKHIVQAVMNSCVCVVL